MDVSPEYILQCEKAEEIQNIIRIRGLKLGDYVFVGHHITLIFFDIEQLNKAEELYCKKGVIDRIWLPRQDQLQEMIFGEGMLLQGIGACGQAQYLIDFVNSPCEMWSMEQLWLAFVMKERYNKVWINGEWEVPR